MRLGVQAIKAKMALQKREISGNRIYCHKLARKWIEHLQCAPTADGLRSERCAKRNHDKSLSGFDRREHPIGRFEPHFGIPAVADFRRPGVDEGSAGCFGGESEEFAKILRGQIGLQILNVSKHTEKVSDTTFRHLTGPRPNSIENFLNFCESIHAGNF